MIHTYTERRRRFKVFPLTLGPHGSHLSNVIKSLSADMSELDHGTHIKLNGVQTCVCTATFAYLGDMPQQQKTLGLSLSALALNVASASSILSDLDFDD